jgi:hypothetical protein
VYGKSLRSSLQSVCIWIETNGCRCKSLPSSILILMHYANYCFNFFHSYTVLSTDLILPILLPVRKYAPCRCNWWMLNKVRWRSILRNISALSESLFTSVCTPGMLYKIFRIICLTKKFMIMIMRLKFMRSCNSNWTVM